jgi:hypothetical protein
MSVAGRVSVLVPGEPKPGIARVPSAVSRTGTVSASGLRLRELPTTQGRVLDTLAPGASVFVMDAMVEHDGMQWVPVRVTGDKLGWVASDGLE